MANKKLIFLTYVFLAIFIYIAPVQSQINSLSDLEFTINNVSKTIITNDGNMAITGTPTAPQHVATKAYVDAASGAISGGANGQVQFNNASVFDADGAFVWGNINKKLILDNTSANTKGVLQLGSSLQKVITLLAPTELLFALTLTTV